MNTENLKDEVVRGPSGEERVGEQIGTGGEGTVYHLQDTPSEVVKIFEREKCDEKADKVRAMIARPPIDPTYKHRNRRSIIWPTAVIEDPRTGEFLGYQMPYKDLDKQENAQRYARENLLWDDSEPEVRYKTALNLAIVVNAIHQQGHAMGDMNHQNILIEKGGYVSLIDCDAFHIKGPEQIYSGEVFFSRYTPPEGRGNTLTEVRRSDRFGLGIHIFQLLMEGFHPFQAKGSGATGGSFDDMIDGNEFPYENPEPGELEPHSRAPDYQSLPKGIREQFGKCFVSGKAQPITRPTPQTWISTLREASGLANDEGGTTDSGKEGSSETEEDTRTGQSIREGTTTRNQQSTGKKENKEAEKSIRELRAEGSPASGSATNATTATKTPGGASGTTHRSQRHGGGSMQSDQGRASSASDSIQRQKTKATQIGATVASELRRTLIYIGGLLVILMVIYALLVAM